MGTVRSLGNVVAEFILIIINMTIVTPCVSFSKVFKSCSAFKLVPQVFHFLLCFFSASYSNHFHKYSTLVFQCSIFSFVSPTEVQFRFLSQICL